MLLSVMGQDGTHGWNSPANGRANRRCRTSPVSDASISLPSALPLCPCAPSRVTLGVVSSAVYRYVASRDELLTLLVVDGYTELGAEVDAAVNAVAAEDFRGQFIALGRAVRSWGDPGAGPLRSVVRQPRPRLRRSGRADHRPRHPRRDPA